MAVEREIIIGTRGSELALRQADAVKEKLVAARRDIKIGVKVIKTEGDKNLNPIPSGTVGKQWFTKEIERELTARTIDMAVHSLKDMSAVLPEGLAIGACLKRDDNRDVLVTKRADSLSGLSQNDIVATDSSRRKAQVLHLRPDLKVESIRGNVNTRLRKLDEGKCGALVLAASGLKRLGLEEVITQYFDPNYFVPAPGQGALAVEIRADDRELADIVSAINDPETELCVRAERSFALNVGGGCKTPVGAFASFHNGGMVLHGMVASLDGSQIIKEIIEGEKNKAEELGETLAKRILRRCPKDVLEHINHES